MNDFTTFSLTAQLFLVFIAVVGTARLTRLFSQDSFPPINWARQQWIARFNTSEWSTLAICPFCQAPYIAAFTLATGWFTDFHPIWIAFYAWLTLAYLAAVFVMHDGGDKE